jgi:hypothetical protein
MYVNKYPKNVLEPLIIWEKWVDPFGDNQEETKWTDYNNQIDHINNDTDQEDSPNNGLTLSNRPIRVIASPLGLIPYNEHTASSKIFNFWIGHSNFNICDQVKNTIEQTEGVEILDIFTRYRFRIAIGKCFENSDVMSRINTNVYKII